MEKGFAFQTPAFLGTRFRQNHQIRQVKNNSRPHLASHRSLYPNTSHSAPSLGLLTARGLPVGANFARTHLSSHRRCHLRRCYDLVHICLQRRQLVLAARFLRVILAAHEWTTDETWRLALVILSLQPSPDGEPSGSSARIRYLQQLDLEESSVFKATNTTYALVGEYVAAGKLLEAVELLEQRVNMHPYKSQPELHTTLGLLYVFLGLKTLESRGQMTEEGVGLRALDRTTREKARRCFEQAVQVGDACVRTETHRRQRIYFMHRKHERHDAARLAQTRMRLWGTDPLQADTDDAWPEKEHPDIAKVRRRLARAEGHEDEEEPGQSGSETAGEDDSARSDMASSGGDSDDEPERGRSRTRTPSQPRDPYDKDEEDELDEDRGGEEGEGEPRTGPRAWATTWPEVASTWTVAEPFAVEMARTFLLLFPAVAPRPTPQPEPEDDTRLRQILFDDPDVPESVPASEDEQKPRRKDRKHGKHSRHRKREHRDRTRERKHKRHRH
ncbi:uncharacterized protein PAN0_005c2765 [Moesziomyces antarcticus]|uniref:Uncharacterized protein n=2 Tax=Pseudozyma antarctica TaxID=84753 RepID=A0A5C3FL51_PSEA2|nr:uncharacterized protein PAN0_005c2765 [Moesziomyces antarcticus]GAK64551.1 hypothetical protein PAN0_005c2765 [Moesziomyces antarcticus]SPO44940.1 uncharacterized protein PSANT_02626 [Moesziomyces antarcticus]